MANLARWKAPFDKFKAGSGTQTGIKLQRYAKVDTTVSVTPTPSPANSTASYDPLYVVLRTFGLHLVPGLRRGAEQPKTAIFHDRLKASLHCLIHLVPLSGALTLISLNLTWYFAGVTFDTLGLPAMQFAAKVHEMTMVASLTTTLLSYIRYELVSEQGLPFGAALAGLQANQLSYLWSPDFWGSLCSKSYRWPLKARLFVAIALCAGLIASVGPASATCMIPRYTSFALQSGSLSYNISTTQLFPSVLDPSLYSSNCNSESVIPEPFWVVPCTWSSQLSGTSDLMSLISVLVGIAPYYSLSAPWPGQVSHSDIWRFTAQESEYPVQIALTLSSSLISENLTLMSSTQNQALVSGIIPSNGPIIPGGVLDVKGTMDSYSFVHCNEETVNWNVTDTAPHVQFPEATSTTDWLTEQEEETLRADFQRSAAGNSTYHDVVFVDLDNRTSSGVVLMMSGSRDAQILTLLTCICKLGWLPSHLYQPLNAQSLYGVGDAYYSRPLNGNDSSSINNIHASKAWLETANPVLAGSNMTAFAYLASTLDAQILANQGGSNYNQSMAIWQPSDIVPQMLFVSALLTTTLSKMTRAPSTDSGGGQISIGSIPYATPWNPGGPLVTQFPAQFSLVGYGYGTNILGVQISVAILMLYCAVAIAHIVYSIWTGTSSTTWDSFSEVMALCINSRPAVELQNTCAGIRSVGVYEHSVRIAATNGVSEGGTAKASDFERDSAARHLELLFPSGSTEALSRLKEGFAYGNLKIKVE